MKVLTSHGIADHSMSNAKNVRHQKIISVSNHHEKKKEKRKKNKKTNHNHHSTNTKSHTEDFESKLSKKFRNSSLFAASTAAKFTGDGDAEGVNAAPIGSGVVVRSGDASVKSILTAGSDDPAAMRDDCGGPLSDIRTDMVDAETGR